jgi:hypothetical protein
MRGGAPSISHGSCPSEVAGMTRVVKAVNVLLGWATHGGAGTARRIRARVVPFIVWEEAGKERGKRLGLSPHNETSPYTSKQTIKP